MKTENLIDVHLKFRRLCYNCCRFSTLACLQIPLYLMTNARNFLLLDCWPINISFTLWLKLTNECLLLNKLFHFLFSQQPKYSSSIQCFLTVLIFIKFYVKKVPSRCDKYAMTMTDNEDLLFNADGDNKIKVVSELNRRSGAFFILTRRRNGYEDDFEKLVRLVWSREQQKTMFSLCPLM